LGDVGIEKTRKTGVMEEEKRGKDGRREFGILECWKGGRVGFWSGESAVKGPSPLRGRGLG